MKLFRLLRGAWNYSRYYFYKFIKRDKDFRSFLEFRLKDFDRKYGTDTQDVVQVADLGMNGTSKLDAQKYEATESGVIRAMVRAAKLDPRGFTFVDLGSGKGRALILAAELRFRDVIGVEFSARMHAIALNNLAIYRRRRSAKAAPASLCQDAAQFVFPTVPLVVFLFNPFGGQVLEIVLKNLVSSITANPRTVFVFWNGVSHFEEIRAIFERAPGLIEMVSQDNFRIYRVFSNSSEKRLDPHVT